MSGDRERVVVGTGDRVVDRRDWRVGCASSAPVAVDPAMAASAAAISFSSMSILSAEAKPQPLSWGLDRPSFNVKNEVDLLVGTYDS